MDHIKSWSVLHYCNILFHWLRKLPRVWWVGLNFTVSSDHIICTVAFIGIADALFAASSTPLRR